MAHSRRRGKSIHPSLRMKIGYEFAFGNVTVSGEPDAAAASSFCCCIVEKTPCPRYRESVATFTGIARRVSTPSSRVLKKLIAATPTTSPWSTASETIPSPPGFLSNHQVNSSSESCVVPTRASSATSDARHSGV